MQRKWCQVESHFTVHFQETGGIRGVRLVDATLFPPSDSGWGTTTYICVRPDAEAKKRKKTAGDGAEAMDVGDNTKRSKEDEPDETDIVRTTDLIVLGIPFATKEDTLR